MPLIIIIIQYAVMSNHNHSLTSAMPSQFINQRTRLATPHTKRPKKSD